MFRNLALLTVAAMMLSGAEGYAMPREREHQACLEKAVTDADFTKCRETEIRAVENMLPADENKLRKQKLLQQQIGVKGEGIEDMRAYFMKYMRSHCLYYVLANSGNGYSDAYNKAKCELADILQYEDNILSIDFMANSDIKF